MLRWKSLLGLILLFSLAACNLGGSAQPTQAPEITPLPPPVPTTAPQPVFTAIPPTALFVTAASFPTAIPPATTAPLVQSSGSITRLLSNGVGLSSGRLLLNGEFEVESYCARLNPTYGVNENDVDWFCTYNGQRALTLREHHFTDICRISYTNPGAFAVHTGGSQPANLRWRCFEYTITPTPTVVRLPVLLTNGVGLSTGGFVTNGEFEVEAYCSAINASYGVNEDGNSWYCTVNDQRILTLGSAEFDDICFRTYTVPGAFAIQQQASVPAYGWRCYAYLE